MTLPPSFTVTIGLTGGIACGKSTIASLLEAEGFRRSDSDAIVRELLAEDNKVIHAISSRFSDEMLEQSGGIDRGALARVVFQDSQALSWLEELLHPVVGQIWQERIQAEPDRNWVVEIPLLFEKSLEIHFDIVVATISSQACQLKRLAAKGIPRKMALARIKRQMPMEQKASRADFVIDNNGSLEFLKRQTSALIRQVTSPV